MADIVERTGGRFTVNADGTLTGADRPFFLSRPLLVEHARRARREAR